jgi:hypothetical protein
MSSRIKASATPRGSSSGFRQRAAIYRGGGVRGDRADRLDLPAQDVRRILADRLAGLAAAASLHRAGRPVEGWVTCALTALLISPVSWDHHWVWRCSP